MHWLPIGLLGAGTLVAQTAFAPRMELAGARPDFPLLLIVFFGLFAAPRRAILMGWGLGFFADLLSVERMGLLSLSYGLTAWALVSARESLFGRGWMMQILVTLTCALATRAAWFVYVQVVYGGFMGSAQGILAPSLYTAAMAPLTCGVLGAIAPLFGVPRRGSHMNYSSLGYSHV